MLVGYVKRCEIAAADISATMGFRPHWSDNSPKAREWRERVCLHLRLFSGRTELRRVTDLFGYMFDIEYYKGTNVHKDWMYYREVEL